MISFPYEIDDEFESVEQLCLYKHREDQHEAKNFLSEDDKKKNVVSTEISLGFTLKCTARTVVI